jgi:hypothetical protein
MDLPFIVLSFPDPADPEVCLYRLPDRPFIAAVPAHRSPGGAFGVLAGDKLEVAGDA